MYTLDPSGCSEFDIFMDELDDHDGFELEFQDDPSDALDPRTDDDDHMEVESDQESTEALDENEDGLDESSDEMEGGRPSTPPVVDHIEKMVISFLTQLAFPGKRKKENESAGSSSESDDESPEKRRRKYSVQIHLIDRKKTEVDG